MAYNTGYYLYKSAFSFKDHEGKDKKLSVGDILEFNWDPDGGDKVAYGLTLGLVLAKDLIGDNVLTIYYLDIGRNKKTSYSIGLGIDSRDASFILRVFKIYELQETHSKA